MKKLLKYALNYDEIINFTFKKEDFITQRIIKYYQEYLFRKVGCTSYRIKLLDKTIYEYLTNFKFNNYVKKYLKEIDDSDYEFCYYDNLDINLPKLYKNYENENLYLSNTRWL